MKPLPPELWFLITTFVPLPSLPALALVSSTLLPPSRCALYRRLTLDNSHAHVRATCAMLEGHPTLARRVEELELRTTRVGGSEEGGGLDADAGVDDTGVEMPINTDPDALSSSSLVKGDRTWIPLDTIKRMVNLRQLTLRGWPLAGPHTQKQLVDVLSSCCPKLRVFRYEPACLGYGFVGYPHQFEIRGLEKVFWGGEPVLCGADLSLLKASANTLTHLSYSGQVDTFDTAQLRHLSTSFHFPNLLHLEFGPFFDTSDDFDIAESLTRFLVLHPTIQSLKLGYDAYHAEFDPSMITKEFLPNLKAIDAHTTNVETLARKGCTSLAQLTSLKIGPGQDEDAAADVWDLLNSLKRVGGLPVLTRFCMRLGERAVREEGDVDAFMDWMEIFAGVCPRVEVWEGDLPPGMSLHKILEIFTRFAHVREVRLRMWMVPEPSMLSKIDATRALASQCGLLERIYFDFDVEEEEAEAGHFDGGGEAGLDDRGVGAAAGRWEKRKVHRVTVLRGVNGEMESTRVEEVDESESEG
ncbi:hypothetical protein BJ165DRAFT_666451 [Panaeolus papilionaceus]|nr:hypothetical protein BJ165DRAFT_666451 [Panaeolus papilionaceus]